MIIRNRLIPFGSFLAINLCGLIFVRRGHAFTPTDLNHERIHTRQQLELLYLPFFLLYLLEWLFRLCAEPRRLWRRYLSGNPRFILLVLRQWITRRPAPLGRVYPP